MATQFYRRSVKDFLLEIIWTLLMHSFATITDNSTMLKISDTQFCMVITKHINGHITALLLFSNQFTCDGRVTFTCKSSAATRIFDDYK